MSTPDPFYQRSLTRFSEAWGVFGEGPKLPVNDAIPNGINWALTVNNPCNPAPWLITENSTRIRYNVVDSLNCGGTCNAIQSGTATALITVGSKDTDMVLSFEGMGEIEDANFELIRFVLNGVELAKAHALGGDQGCGSAPVVKQIIVPGPYRLTALTNYTFRIDFTTNDELFHTGAFYEIKLDFLNVL